MLFQLFSIILRFDHKALKLIPSKFQKLPTTNFCFLLIQKYKWKNKKRLSRRIQTKTFFVLVGW